MEEKITKETKERYTVWMMPSTREEVEELMKMGNCKRISEFIEKAVNFYCGYLRSSTQDYVPQIVLTTLKSLMNENENRHNGSLFRIAVELSMIKNLIAYTNGIGQAPLDKLRADCASEVKKINGTISFEDAIRWQA